MERTTFNLLFYIKKTKLLKNGDAPIYLRITINGASAEIAIKRSVKMNLWDVPRNKAKGTSAEAMDINEYLTSVRGQLFNYHKQLQEAGKVVSANTLKNMFLGVGEKQWTLKELYSEHNNNMKMLVGKEFSPLSLQRFEAGYKHALIFMKRQYNNEELPLSEINHKFVTGFEFYLKTTAKCQHNSAMKHMKALKKVIRIGLANDYIRKDPFAAYKITTKSVEKGYLSESEIKTLVEKEFSIERINIVKDLFLFQCFTGLAYLDMANLTVDNIQMGIDGNKWIYTKRKKTKVSCHIPLFPIAERIVNKYADHPAKVNSERLFPVPSNQKMNAYLKEVADLCGIKKSFHTHMARHTYATTVTLLNGIPLETVSRLLGHTKIQTTQVYAKVLDEKISKDMEVLRLKMA